MRGCPATPRGGYSEADTMRTVLLILAALLTFAAGAAWAAPRTMRVDYTHSGTAAAEHFGLDRVVLEGEWPGPGDRRIDTTNLGKYSFEVVDRATNRVVYTRGFA